MWEAWNNLCLEILMIFLHLQMIFTTHFLWSKTECFCNQELFCCWVLGATEWKFLAWKEVSHYPTQLV